MRYPEAIRRLALKRVNDGATERAHVLAVLSARRPLEAEPDKGRRLRRIQAAVGVDEGIAASLARNVSPKALGLSGGALAGAERIQGTTDFVDVAFLMRGQAAAATVGRVVFRNLRPQGSGFLVSDRLFLTNHHVIKNVEDAKGLLVEFNYERDAFGQPRQVSRFELDPETFLLASPDTLLDYCLVAIGQQLAGDQALPDFGFCPLSDADDKHMLGEYVNVIQHPEGDLKQIVVRENKLTNRFPTALHYVADTLGGSSGSPIFNDAWEAIALHHWGGPHTETVGPDGKPVSTEINEGIRISAIVGALRAQRDELTHAKKALLDVLLKCTFRYPSGLPALLESRLEATGGGPATGRVVVSAPAASETRFVVPLEITVRIGNANAVPSGIESSSRLERAERISPDRTYGNRRGYDPDFLPGFRVPLPSLGRQLAPKAARVIGAKGDEDPHELRYEHFSVVMHEDRRMAIMTAVNIDGASWISVDRTTGEVGDAEAREVWYDDPRISDEAQTAQDLYDDQVPRRLFDRGHLVRRQDPSWGTPEEAKRANADTFHFTNCAPQESAFNQRAQFWQGIENYVLNNAKAEGAKICVFTGPVLDSKDPPYRYVHVPCEFWKILVRVDGGQLLATALLADQSDRIQRLPERLQEAFDDLSRVREYQTTVARIERLTGLDFGVLRTRDTFRTNGESTDGQRILDDLKSLQLDDAAPRVPRNARAESDLRSSVVGIIANVSGRAAAKIKDGDRLMEDLGLSVALKRALAEGFQRVARENNPKAKVTGTECAGLLTVAACIGFVAKKSRRTDK